MKRKSLLLLTLTFISTIALSQKIKKEKIIIRGVVKTNTEKPIENVKIFVDNKKNKRTTNKKGFYTIILDKKPKKIKFKSKKHKTKTINYQGINLINVTLIKDKNDTSDKYRRFTNIYDYLRGQPGVEVLNNSQVIIRGVSSLNASTTPLFIVNGKQAVNLDINMNDVKEIKILRRPDELAIYGSRGANGVIIINTL